jgi:polysaccharide pyruvyl transferase WcaK-like protein
MGTSRKTITLAYVYGPRNSGDMALNIGALDVLRSCGDFNIFAVSRFAEDHPDYLETKRYLENLYRNVQVVPFPVLYDRKTQTKIEKISSFVKGGFLYFPTIKQSFLKNNKVYECISKSDLVIFNGGNLLFARDIKDFFRLGGITYPLQLARDLKIPYGFFPQSLPEITFSQGRKLVSKLMNDSHFCLFRESASLEKAQELGVQGGEHSLDLAFFISRTDELRANQIMAGNELIEKKFVPIILRTSSLGDQGTLSEEIIEDVLEWTKELVSSLLEQSMDPVFVVQTRQDLDVSLNAVESIAKSRKEIQSVPVIEEYDPLVLRGLYKKAKAIFTFRLHAAIFALSVGTPAIGIYRKEWGPKMPGIYKDIGVPEMCIESENKQIALDKCRDLVNLEISSSISRAKANKLKRIMVCVDL